MTNIDHAPVANQDARLTSHVAETLLSAIHTLAHSLNENIAQHMATSQPFQAGGAGMDARRGSTSTPTPLTSSDNAHQRHSAPKEEMGWRRIVRNFTPSWFAVNMGTGIVSILLCSLPYTTSWVPYVADAFFALNVCLFLIFTAITLARYLLYPEIWAAMLNHPGQSLFLGTFPMGLASEFCLHYTSTRVLVI